MFDIVNGKGDTAHLGSFNTCWPGLIYVSNQCICDFLRAGQHPKGWIVTNRFLTLLLRGTCFFLISLGLLCMEPHMDRCRMLFTYTLAEKRVVCNTVGPAEMC